MNSLHGPIPSRIGDLSDLTKLDLNNNLLTSSVPTGVGNLTALKTLLLYYNSITGSIPETIGNLHLLTMLEMDSNRYVVIFLRVIFLLLTFVFF